jgi:hypothetical protein
MLQLRYDCAEKISLETGDKINQNKPGTAYLV